jgi:integrase
VDYRRIDWPTPRAEACEAWSVSKKFKLTHYPRFMQAWKKTTLYTKPDDWVFASVHGKGEHPRVANMLVEDHLRPAAVRAKVIAEADPCRFGFHNLRHSLASFLVRTKTDPKTVRALLRHSDVKTTLQLYAHSVSEDRMTAQGEGFRPFLVLQVRLRAD